jgi:hypothetical protein
MTDNRVSATLSDADQQEILSDINNARQKLSFLVDLTPDERRTILRMGDGSRAFVSQALEVASQNMDILPRSFDLEEMRKDVELLDALAPIMLALAQLNELVDDTFMEVGSEAYAAALAVYQYVRAAGKGAALDSPPRLDCGTSSRRRLGLRPPWANFLASEVERRASQDEGTPSFLRTSCGLKSPRPPCSQAVRRRS